MRGEERDNKKRHRANIKKLHIHFLLIIAQAGETKKNVAYNNASVEEKRRNFVFRIQIMYLLSNFSL
jgi:hypothetical protein